MTTSETGYKHGELNAVTRAAVLEAVAECDAVGMHAFLERHGYRPSLKYQLRFRGKSYPSKAVLGVAAGLSSSEFFGGAAVVVRHLTRLGFQVREGRRVVTALGLLALARVACDEDAPSPFTMPDLPTEPAAYFASGSNRAAEIRGLAAVGQDVGVAAPELGEESMCELEKLAGTDVQVFVDSGAFSEVEFGPEGVRVVAPISAEEWADRLAAYKRLARALGPSVWLVAPDMVGSQDVTLARLATYAGEMRELAALGARILVPVQKGTRSQAAFAAEVDEVLAGVEWFPAMPCKKAATTPQELEAFIAERKPEHVHLLGLGPMNREAGTYLAHVKRAGCSVSLDSNWIAANVGRAASEKANAQRSMWDAPARPRRYTWAQDVARRVLAGVKAFAVKVRELAFMVAFGLASVLGLEGGEE